jgi:hypothetical protein
LHIRWSGEHIKGHQDEDIPFEQLSWPSQLNVIVDQIAKDFLSTMNESTRHYSVDYNAWSIWVGPNTIVKDIDQILYDLVHTPKAKTYWMTKSRMNEFSFALVNWTRLGQALNKMPLSRHLFCSKHTTGMCGVGKYQKIWKLRKTNSCPHCGQFEDALHVWKRQEPHVKEVWENSLITLKNSLRRLDTDPDLLTIIIDYLNAWCDDEHLQALDEETYRSLLEGQNDIGARQFFEGWLHSEWEVVQEKYYMDINSCRSSKRWTVAIITKL